MCVGANPSQKADLPGDEGLVFKKFLWENAENGQVIIKQSNEQITDKKFLDELRKLKRKQPFYVVLEPSWGPLGGLLVAFWAPSGPYVGPN